MDLKTTWGEAAAAARGRLSRGSPSAPFRAVETDSRRLLAAAPGGPPTAPGASYAPGAAGSGRVPAAFWAIQGKRVDAHQFLDARLAAASDGWVVRAGAPLPADLPPRVLEVPDTAQALSDLGGWHRRRFDIPVVGVTGSNGKTTVKEMVRAVLARRGKVCATAGNLNNEFGLPLSLLELDAESRFGVFEMGASREGDIRALAKVAGPTAAVLTNVGPAHLEFFGDLEGVYRAKSELVDALPPDGPAALNLDDPFLARLAARLGRRAVTYGRDPRSQARLLESGKGEAVLDLRGRLIRVAARAGTVFGAVHRINAAAAAALGLALGLGAEEIEAGLKDFRPAPLRFARRTHASGAVLVVDAYNANPASMRAGIETFLETAEPGQLLAVLGDMKELGPGSADLHRDLGRWLAGLPLSGVFLAGPEMEAAARALREAGAAFPVAHAADALSLAAGLRPRLKKGCAAYFKGSRAMRLEELIEAL